MEARTSLLGQGSVASQTVLQWVALAIFLLTASSLPAAESYKIVIPFRSSASGAAEIYYDSGTGFTKQQSSTQVVHASSTMRILKFDLPAGIAIKTMRLDPLNGPGSFEIGPPSIEAPDGRVIRALDLSVYWVWQQLRIISKGPDTLKIEAPPRSRDPIVMIKLQNPIDLPALGTHKITSKNVSRYEWPAWLDAGLIILALVVLGSALVWPAEPERGRTASRWFLSPRLGWMDRLAARLSDPELIVFDRASLLVLFVAGAVFIVFCAFQLHGSSTAMWDLRIADEIPHNGLLWGHAKHIRSDEFTVFTPNTFSQVYSKPAFSPTNRTVGGGQSVLFWTHPVNHFIEIPRFFLWPFHFLSINSAFSIFWNLKGLILFIGSYLLLLVLTGSRALLAALGALWIYFSGFTQWWFSHVLPEDIGFAALTLVGALYLVLSRKRSLVYGSAILLTIALLNFTLILYPPFAIPLAWVMLSIGLGIFIEKRKLLFSADPLKIRWVLLALVIALCAATLAAFMLDTRETIHMIRNTAYPGHRFNTGGTETLLPHFVSLIDSVFTENHIPNIDTRVDTSTHYNLLGLLVLPVIFIVRPSRPRFTAVDGLLALCTLSLLVFVLIGFPHWLAGPTLLSMTESKRVKLGIGLGAVFLLMRHFSRTPAGQRVEAADLQVALSLLTVLVIAFVFFQMTSTYELPGIALSMLLAVNAALLLFAVAGQSARFFAVLLPLLLTHNFLINPVARGFRAITDKDLYREVCDIRRSDPEGKWVVFGSHRIANFLKFCGVEMINGNKFYPVFEYNNALDPQHHYIHIWNGYSQVEFTDNPEYRRIYYEELRGTNYRVNVPAGAPALEKIGVRYCVLTSPPPASYQPAVLKHVQDGKKDYWILRRDLIPSDGQ